jgi:methionine-gamma-lyase
MVFVETPANPTNDLSDIEMASRIAADHSRRDRRAFVAVDNTFLGPLWQHPLEHGADLVVYSATKYIGGHSDLIAGAVLGSANTLEPIARMRAILGSIASPWTGWLLMRSLETLSLRMQEQTRNARRVADFLAGHPLVGPVHYLGLLEADDPQHDLYKRQCLGPGAMISFEIEGGDAAAETFVDSLRLIHLAVSLGSTESLVEIPAIMTHLGVPEEVREKFGISPSLVRLSVGVEDPEDLILDIGQALQSIERRSNT